MIPGSSAGVVPFGIHSLVVVEKLFREFADREEKERAEAVPLR